MSKNTLIGIGAFIFIVLIVVVVVLASKGGEKKSRPAQITFPKEPVTLVWWNLFDEEDVFKKLLTEYHAKRPNVTIKYIKKDYETYEQDLLNALAAGTGPDIFVLRHDWMPKHLDKITPMPDGMDLIEKKKKEPEKDLSTQFKELFVPGAYSTLVYENKIYGIPLWMDSLALYYNKDIFERTLQKRKEELNRLMHQTENEERKKIEEKRKQVSNLLSQPPSTWDDFIEVVKLITEKDGKGNIVQPAVAMGTANNVERAADLLSLLMLQNNTQMVTADKKTAIFNLSTKKQDGSIIYPGTMALDFYTAFARPEKEVYTWNKSFPNAVEAFGRGQVAMMFNYSYYIPILKRKYPELNFEVAPMPQIKEILQRVDYSYYWPIVVSKNTQYPQVAWDFLKFIAAKDKIKAYAQQTQRPSSLKEVAKSISLYSQTAYLEGLKGLKVYSAQAWTAINWYKGGEPEKIEEVFKIMINSVLAGQPLQTAIDTAAASVTNILQSAEPLIERKVQEEG